METYEALDGPGLAAQRTVVLYHWTLEDRAEGILRDGFRDGRYNSFTGDGPSGVYLCTGKERHSGGNTTLLVVEIPEQILLAAESDACPLDDMDYLIPAIVVNKYPVFRIES